VEKPPLPFILWDVEKSVESLWKSPKNAYAGRRFLKLIVFLFFLLFLVLGLVLLLWLWLVLGLVLLLA
jgi:hypothetical protein